jgi:para-aminobenzoate synthetase/4-amino-4-deoxychorismate lyase
VEGGRSSVFLRLDGRWWTPPVSDGALPGVMRAQMLADPLIAAAERRLTLADLQRTEAIWVSNALRGVLRAELAPGQLADPLPAEPVSQAG